MRIAIAQVNATRDIDHNLARCADLAKRAADQGARWILFPENAPYLGRDRDKLAVAQPLDGSMVEAFQTLATTHKSWITLGSFPEVSPSPDHTYNTQVLIAPDGSVAAVYRKRFLFDIDLPGGPTLRESDSILPGDAFVVADVTDPDDPSATYRVGLSICYDLRFPEHYRRLTLEHGAQVLTVPSAFTLETGRAHWHALLRARAIENQAYVLAPDQVGPHGQGRASFGGSVAYDPWGDCLACVPDGEGVIMAELSLERLAQVR